MLTINIKRILFVWIYIASLTYAVYHLSFTWGYSGINFYEPSITTYLLLYTITIIPVFFIPKRLIKPSDYVNIYFYLITFIPACIIPILITKPANFKYDYYVYVVVFLLCLLYLMRNPYKKVRVLKLIKPLPPKFYLPVIVCIYVFAVIVFTFSFGFNLSLGALFSFKEVYEVRAHFKDVVSDNALPAYLIGWMGYIINMFVYLIGLKRRNKKIIIFAVCFQLYLFAIMALKSHIATLILVTILYFYFSKHKDVSSSKFIFYVAIMIFAFGIFDTIIGADFFNLLLTRRIMVMPSQLAYYHYDFFSTHPKTFWFNSILKGFGSYSYDLPPPNLISKVYFDKPEMTSVINFFMEGYTAFGYFGLILVTMLFKYIISIIDNIYKDKSQNNIIIIILLLGLCNVLNSSSLFTILLTHGWGLFILLIIKFNWRKSFKQNAISG